MNILSQIHNSEQILIWPEFTWASTVNGTILLFTVLAIAYILHKLAKKRNERTKAYRERILAKLDLRVFQSKDIILFHEFIYQLSYTKLRKISEDPAWYAKYFIVEFMKFLGDHTNIPSWKIVLLVQLTDTAVSLSENSQPGYIPAILQINTKEDSAILLEVDEASDISLGKRISGKIYAKRGDNLLSLKKNPNVQLYFQNWNNIWFKVTATLRSHNEMGFDLFIKDIPEKDNIRTTNWIEAPREKKFVETKVVQEPIEPGEIYKEYKDSLTTILEYSSVAPDVAGQIRNLVKSFMEHPGYIRRKHRQEDYKILIQLYRACFLKFRSQTENIPKPVLLFMYFFFLDETLVSERRIIDLESSVAALKVTSATASESKSKILIHLFPDWLNLVLGGKRNPSKNQMGQTYDQVEKSKLLWNQGAEVKNLRDKEYLLKLLDWELDSLLYMGILGISLNPNFAYPILSEDQFYGDTAGSLLHPHKISTSVEKILKMDPGLFSREVNANSSSNLKIVNWMRKEYFADFILLPYGGDRGVLWQDTSEGNISRSRLLFPTVFKENIDLAVTKALGEFRWETERSFRGRKWKDSPPDTMTSQYNEYLEYFPNSPSLTFEAKKKIKEQWTKARQNIKDMFAVDYANWILYEQIPGRSKLNAKVREILSRYIQLNLAA
ncbi:hypothetical protein [Leptospira johnsonii]|uniref:Uncharacterized protein n=1 Tax=Leptospira johnsonii TaxID=1917820 RepID=A0A2P2D1J1_9LEPT|nr:hypothetical protein [Leptospira johnsonii]GBF38517.1 hypothetical protein LPTSP1_15100 [Leptospira johnsonii]